MGVTIMIDLLRRLKLTVTAVISDKLDVTIMIDLLRRLKLTPSFFRENEYLKKSQL